MKKQEQGKKEEEEEEEEGKEDKNRKIGIDSVLRKENKRKKVNSVRSIETYGYQLKATRVLCTLQFTFFTPTLHGHVMNL